MCIVSIHIMYCVYQYTFVSPSKSLFGGARGTGARAGRYMMVSVTGMRWEDLERKSQTKQLIISTTWAATRTIHNILVNLSPQMQNTT